MPEENFTPEERERKTNLSMAISHARVGIVPAAKLRFSIVEDLDQKAGIETPQEDYERLNQAYKYAMEVNLSRAEEEPYNLQQEFYLEKALKCAREINLDISDRIREIKEIDAEYDRLGIKEVHGHRCPECNEVIGGKKLDAIAHVKSELGDLVEQGE